MNINDVSLGKLAVANLLFKTTSYNQSLIDFNENTARKLDLIQIEHRKCLLIWLNAWGCRNLLLSQHPIASASILKWYQEYGSSLFTDEKPLWELSEKELNVTAKAYGSLKDKIGGIRIRAGNKQEVHIGPTAASKILFAIKPKTLMPWDEEMRKYFDCTGSKESYLKYLLIIKKLTLQIRDLCEARGFPIDNLPQKLEDKDSTVMMLLNEYIWIMATKKVPLPSPQTLALWAELG